jgi:hypothetical protein
MLGAELIAALGIFAAQASLLAKPHRNLEFDTMVGVPQAFTGSTNAALIRGVNGGGIPWVLDRGRGELHADGRLRVRVEGLVLASGANAGINPVAATRGSTRS